MREITETMERRLEIRTRFPRLSPFPPPEEVVLDGKCVQDVVQEHEERERELAAALRERAREAGAGD